MLDRAENCTIEIIFDSLPGGDNLGFLGEGAGGDEYQIPNYHKNDPCITQLNSSQSVLN